MILFGFRSPFCCCSWRDSGLLGGKAEVWKDHCQNSLDSQIQLLHQTHLGAEVRTKIAKCDAFSIYRGSGQWDQFDLTSWQWRDQAAPNSLDMVDFVTSVRHARSEMTNSGPLVVHCRWFKLDNAVN